MNRSQRIGKNLCLKFTIIGGLIIFLTPVINLWVLFYFSDWPMNIGGSVIGFNYLVPFIGSILISFFTYLYLGKWVGKKVLYEHKSTYGTSVIALSLIFTGMTLPFFSVPLTLYGIYIALLLAIFMAKNLKTRIIMPIDKIKNEQISKYDFLSYMYSDPYFPSHLIDKCRSILIELCISIEEKSPRTLDDLYRLSHYSTIQINNLQDEFHENNSEIETGARECIAEDFEFIAKAYGFDADIEELIEPRDW